MLPTPLWDTFYIPFPENGKMGKMGGKWEESGEMGRELGENWERIGGELGENWAPKPQNPKCMKSLNKMFVMEYQYFCLLIPAAQAL